MELPRNVNFRVNQLISVGFVVGFFGCLALGIYQAIKYVILPCGYVILATNSYFHWRWTLLASGHDSFLIQNIK